MKNTDFPTLKSLLATPQRILLTTHTNPDGDAIGSSLAFYGYLVKKGHLVSMMVPDPFPSFLAWLPNAEKILVYSAQGEETHQAIKRSTLIFSLDYNDLNRLQDACEAVKNSSAVKVVLDHHLYPSDGYDHFISITETSSTAELVYDFIREMGDEDLIDKEIAEAIYTGIITDTGSFSYSCNHVKTYEVVAALFRHGIDGEHIHRLIYDTYSEHRLRLLGYSLSDKLVVLPEFHTAYIYLTADDLEQFQYQIGDTEGVVNYALSIEGIHLAALFSERGNSIRISFRSKGNFSVERLARDHFDGGGHTNASGATSYLTMEETLGRFRALLPGLRDSLARVYS